MREQGLGEWSDEVLAVGHCITSENCSLPFEKEQASHWAIREQPGASVVIKGKKAKWTEHRVPCTPPVQMQISIYSTLQR